MNQVLSKEFLYKTAPSIFTSQAHFETSDKYQQISTISIIIALENEGFYPVWVAQSRSINQENRLFAKHIVRFRHQTNFNSKALFPELVLVNSHDGLSSYRLNAGLYRLVCSNGLVAGTTYNEVRVKHQGDILGNVIEGTFSIAQEANALLESAREMSAIALNKEERFILAEAAHAIRFDEDSSQVLAIKPEALLQARRSADYDNHDLFTTFNVIQENALKGGLRGYARHNGQIRRVATRQIRNIDQNVKLNKALWTLAEKMKEIKR